MRTTRILMAGIAAALLSTAAFAVPPTADQVSVPQGTDIGQSHHRGGRLKALFPSPEEFMMFRMQMRDATRGMPRDQRKAYRKNEFQRIRAMNDAEKASWRQGLDAKWAALSPDRQQRMEAKAQRHAARHEERKQRKGKGQGQYQDQNQDMGQPQQ